MSIIIGMLRKYILFHAGSTNNNFDAEDVGMSTQLLINHVAIFVSLRKLLAQFFYFYAAHFFSSYISQQLRYHRLKYLYVQPLLQPLLQIKCRTERSHAIQLQLAYTDNPNTLNPLFKNII